MSVCGSKDDELQFAQSPSPTYRHRIDAERILGAMVNRRRTIMQIGIGVLMPRQKGATIAFDAHLANGNRFLAVALDPASLRTAQDVRIGFIFTLRTHRPSASFMVHTSLLLGSSDS